LDIDSFIAAHSAEWARLDALAGSRRVSAAEADELVALYRRVATHLALVQSRTPDPALAARLSRLLARARAAVTRGGRVSGWSAFARGVLVDFPTAVYRTWRWSVGIAVASLGLSAAMMLWLRAHPGRIQRVIPSDEVRRLVNHDFRDYYSAHPGQAFAAHVWTNNALVAAMSLFFGVTLIGTLFVMWQNTVNLGVVGGVMIGSGKAGPFFGLVLPHGMLELSAVFVAGGIGLRTGWAWISPGSVPRSQALAQAGRTAAIVAAGLTGVLLVSGVIEAFVTPSGLPTAMRIGIGAAAEFAFVAYIVVFGRRGVRMGATGDLSAQEREDVLPTA
jgi:uncharacterized membrane protein SpoIIM required for sporulation